MMELEFDRTSEDVIAFNLYHMQHSPGAKREALKTRAVLSLVLAWLVVGYNLLNPAYFNWVTLGATLAAALVVFLIYPLLTRRWTVRRLHDMLKEGDNETMFGPQRLVIAPDAIRASNKTIEARIAWAAVQQVAEGEKHLFVLTSAMNAIIIPKTAFKSEAVQQEFVRLVEDYRKAA